MEKALRKRVYNLEFPSWCHAITLFDYQFTRVEDYDAKVASLQHLVNVTSEFKIVANTGGHAVTAYVDLPDRQEKAVLEWRDSDGTALNDILLLLSLFTMRDVFVSQDGENSQAVIVADPRIYNWGGILRTSIPYEKKSIDPYPLGYDIGFEKALNQIYGLIRSQEWQDKYQQGYFLFLAKQALRQHTLEAAFIQCWTIWEHLYEILNPKNLSPRKLSQVDAASQIEFLLVEYGLKSKIDNSSRVSIKVLAKIRNKLVHFGRFPQADAVFEDAELFIRLTESIIASAIGLTPSNIFNTKEKLESF